jgi:hypothetical protein
MAAAPGLVYPRRVWRAFPVMAPIARDYWPAGPANSRESFFHLSVRPRRGVADEVEQLLAVAIGAELVGDAAGFCDDRVVAMAQVGGAAAFVALLAHLLNGGADAGGIGESQFDLLAVDVDGVAVHFGGDLAVGLGGDAGDPRETGVASPNSSNWRMRRSARSRVMPA